MAHRVGDHENSSMVDVEQSFVTDHLHFFSRQPRSDSIARRREADVPALTDASCRVGRRRGCVGRAVFDFDGDQLGDGQTEALVWGDHADALVGPVVVVGLHPRVELHLGVGDGVEDLAGQKLLAQGAMEAFHFPRGGGRTRCGEDVLDAVLPTDLVEEDLGGREPEAIGEDLAIEFLTDVKPRRHPYGWWWTGPATERPATPYSAGPSSLVCCSFAAALAVPLTPSSDSRRPSDPRRG